jgi:transposase InsO family protein
VDPYDRAAALPAVKEALGAPGFGVVIFRRECALHADRNRHMTHRMLWEKYPGVPKTILSNDLFSWRFFWRNRWDLPDSLTWNEPGQVWAMDFTWTDDLVDGVYRRLLVCRDLGSGLVLLAKPVRGERAREVALALWWLFARYGPPLVLKTDNGSAFIAHSTKRLLCRHGVLQLLSPPYCPSYNGACEAGNGAIKTYIRAILSVSAGSRGWTSPLVDLARRFANDRPREKDNPASAPALVFAGRAPIERDARARFLRLYRSLQGDVRLARNLPLEARLGPKDRAAVDRAAIRRALVASGILEIERRRIRPDKSA